MSQVGEFIVTAGDGRLFHCSVERLGDEQIRHWIFHDSDWREYIGPVWMPFQHVTEVESIVREWWAHTPVGKPTEDATEMRRRILGIDV